MQMSVLDWNGLVYYDKKIKKHIKDKISEAVLNGEGGTVDLSAYATKEELKNHTDNANLHVTLAEKNTWNAKLDNSDLTNYATKTYVTDEIAKASTGGTIDLTGYAKTVDVNSALSTKVDKVSGKSLVDDTEIARLALVDNYDDTDIKRSINAKASISDVNAHTSDTSIHITSAERTKWNNKAEMTDIPDLTNYATKTYVTDEIVKASTSGTVDLTAYAKTADVDAKLDTKVDKIDGKGLSTNDYTTDEKTKVEKIKTDGNGKEFLANDGNYVGIYSKKEIDDLLYPILNPYEAPIVNLSASDTLFKVGTTNLVTFTADITKGRDDITSIKFVNGTDTVLKEITDKTELAKTTQTYTLSMTTTETVKVIVSDGISAVEKSVTVTYTYDSYYGIISADKTSLTSNEIKSLNAKLTIDKSFKYDKINLDNQKIAYAYLKSRGELTKILDANNFDYLNSYTRSEINIDGQEYYLYILTKATVIDGFKQIYQ